MLRGMTEEENIFKDIVFFLKFNLVDNLPLILNI